MKSLEGKRIAWLLILLGLLTLAVEFRHSAHTGSLLLRSSDSRYRISAAEGWQPTGIHVEQGQSFTISVVGGQWHDANDTLVSTAGLDYVCGHPDCCEPMPDERRSALIGRVGVNGTPFLIGEGGVYTAASEGSLYFRINDCDSGLYDNRGWIQIEVIAQAQSR